MKATQKYSVTFRGIDGTSTTRFSRLSDAASYVRRRDLGEEYRRVGGLQCEFGFITFNGFSWNDIRPNGDYLLAPPRVTFRKSQFKSHVTGLSLGINAFANGEEAAHICERTEEQHGSNGFDVDFGFGQCFIPGEPRWARFETLEAAKEAIKSRLNRRYQSLVGSAPGQELDRYEEGGPIYTGDM